MQTRRIIRIALPLMMLGLGLPLPAAAQASGDTDDGIGCAPAMTPNLAKTVASPGEAGLVLLSHDGCHISVDCECGSVSCEGQSCKSGSNSVTCDDQTTTCPAAPTCSASTSCPDGSYISCSGPDCSGVGCTQEPGCWVACDANEDGFGLEDFTWCPGFEGCLTCPCGIGGF